MLGDGDGTFTEAEEIAGEGTSPLHVAMGDVNDDDVADIIISDHGGNLYILFFDP